MEQGEALRRVATRRLEKEFDVFGIEFTKLPKSVQNLFLVAWGNGYKSAGEDLSALLDTLEDQING